MQQEHAPVAELRQPRLDVVRSPPRRCGAVDVQEVDRAVGERRRRLVERLLEQRRERAVERVVMRAQLVEHLGPVRRPCARRPARCRRRSTASAARGPARPGRTRSTSRPSRCRARRGRAAGARRPRRRRTGCARASCRRRSGGAAASKTMREAERLEAHRPAPGEPGPRRVDAVAHERRRAARARREQRRARAGPGGRPAR